MQGATEPDPSPGSPDLELRLCPYAFIKGLQKKTRTAHYLSKDQA